MGSFVRQSVLSFPVHLLAAALLPEVNSVAATSWFGKPHLSPRYTNGSVGTSTYDYIIVGGGLSGLVVANRLTEDANKTVLVVEYGYLDNGSIPQIPYDANSLNTADMFDDIVSSPIAGLNNQSFSVWIGATVGGGSVVNGMDLDRGSATDYDAWEALGNPGWGWDGLFPYFKKSTTFTPPSAAVAKKYNYTWDVSAYGDGPVQASMPPWQWSELPYFWAGWSELGVPQPIEGALGDAIGAFWNPNSEDPKTATRSSARTAYYDPVAGRSNLQLLTGHEVTKIMFSNLTAKGVEILSRADNSTTTAFAAKEIIMAAGSIHTPKLLQISGIGPADVLEAAGVDILLDLPAVGANFQDHPVAYLTWNFTHDTYPYADILTTNATYNASAYAQYLSNRTGPYVEAHGNSAAFLPLSTITNTSSTIAARAVVQNSSAYLPSLYTTNPTLLAGYNAQHAIIVEQFRSTNASVYEFPFPGSGSAPIALEKPLSRGTITLNASNPAGEPVVSYNTLQNPIDSSILIAAVRYTRRFFSTSAMAPLGPVEVSPGPAAQSDAQILAALKAGLLQPSFAHPSCSCAMMPRELGGCVGSDLLVYGTQGLSVVDASVMPLIPGAHLQATVYAVAEKAADLIKARA